MVALTSMEQPENQWTDVTPDNWPVAMQQPYVFGQALAALQRYAAGGLRVEGARVTALIRPSEVERVRTALYVAVQRSEVLVAQAIDTAKAFLTDWSVK